LEYVHVTERDQRRFIETVAIRRDADQLLRTLVADRCRCEQKAGELGRADPMKAVTGRSAMDRAIAETQRLIAAMDGVLGECGGGAQPAAAVHVEAKIPSLALV
jgi:hypothetical protein